MRELVIDISKYDDGIDLAAWKRERELWGVIIKLGGNEDAVGGRYSDSVAKSHYHQAKMLGLHIGFYYYTDVRDVAVANVDANHFADLIDAITDSGYYDLPCYMDVEDHRQLALDSRKLTDIIKSFCNTLIHRGYYAGIYTGGSAWLNSVYADELRDYANWIAWWKSTWPNEAGDIGMWQQGCGNIEGSIEFYDNNKSGYRDIDWCCVDYPSRIKNGWTRYQADEQETATDEQPSIDNPAEVQNGSFGRASDVIDAAYAELGYYAPADPEPGSKFGRWMAELFDEDWLAGPSTEIWWCCMFVSFCLDKGGVEMKGFPTYNTDLALNNGGRNYAVDKYDVQYGDIVIFNWDWNSTTDHIGFATGEFDGNGFTTIEGNLGNAVKESYRQMGNVAYILRPPYNGHGPVSSNQPNVSTDPKNNRDGGKLDVDGIGGWNTVIDLQHIFGVNEDGVISGQYAGNRSVHYGMSNVEYGSGGSELVVAIQRKIGAEPDGEWGRETSTKLQKHLQDLGYSIDVDSYFGPQSVKILQQAINDGKLVK